MVVIFFAYCFTKICKIFIVSLHIGWKYLAFFLKFHSNFSLKHSTEMGKSVGVSKEIFIITYENSSFLNSNGDRMRGFLFFLHSKYLKRKWNGDQTKSGLFALIRDIILYYRFIASITLNDCFDSEIFAYASFNNKQFPLIYRYFISKISDNLNESKKFSYCDNSSSRSYIYTSMINLKVHWCCIWRGFFFGYLQETYSCTI